MARRSAIPALVGPSGSRRVFPREWAWVGVASLVVVALFSLPYLVGVVSATPDMAFGGYLLGVDDVYSYIAKMRYGAYDGWLLQLVYTTEPHRGGFAYPLYLILGKLAALVSGQGARVRFETLTAAYHAARVGFSLLLLLVIYRFVAEFLDNPPQRRLAWAVAALAGGLGWLTLALPELAAGMGGDPRPVEFYVPEAFSTLLLYGLPHLALARTLFIAGWLAFFRSLDTSSRPRAFAAGLAWVGMAAIVPFYVALLGVLIAAWLAVMLIAGRRIPWREIGFAALAGGLPLLMIGYYGWLFTQNPVFASWGAGNVLVSPPPGRYALAYGLLIGLAIPGAVTVIRSGITSRTALLLCWPPVTAVLVYLPVSVQRRLLEGVVLPLSVLAALGVWRLVGEKPDRSGRRLAWRLRQSAVAALVMLLFPSTVVLLGGAVRSVSVPQPPVFLPADECAAYEWLRTEAPLGSAVLSTYESGNRLPAFAGVRVYVGHGVETVNFHAKRARAKAFFCGGMADSDRRALLAEAGIDYVWAGPSEQQAPCEPFQPETVGLRPVFSRGSYMIYRVAEQ